MLILVGDWRRKWQPTPVLLLGKSHGRRILVGYSPWDHKELDTTERLHFQFHALEKEMATHSSVLAWRIPGTGEPGGLPSMGSHRVGHDWSDLAAAAAGTLPRGRTQRKMSRKEVCLLVTRYNCTGLQAGRGLFARLCSSLQGLQA